MNPCCYKNCPAIPVRVVCPVHEPQAVVDRATRIVDRRFGAVITEIDSGTNELLRLVRDQILKDLRATI